MAFEELTGDEHQKVRAAFEKAKNETKPNAYNILSCLTTQIDDTFEDFCDTFGYDTDSGRGLQLYLDVQEEYANMFKLFRQQELEELIEILY